MSVPVVDETEVEATRLLVLSRKSSIRLNWRSSDAPTCTVYCPVMVTGDTGAMNQVEGSVVSGGRLLTVMLIEGAVPTLPAASVAVAEIVCDALVALVVSQEQE